MYSLIDCHTHLRKQDPEAGTRLLARAAEGGIEAISIMVVDRIEGPNGNPGALVAKARHPERVFLFPGLDYTALYQEVDHRHTVALGQQVERLIAMGCDGLKMLTGKPNVRHASGIALDSPIYDGAFAR